MSASNARGEAPDITYLISSDRLDRDSNKPIAAAVDFGNWAIRAAILDGSDIVRIIPDKNDELQTRLTDCCLDEPNVTFSDLKNMIAGDGKIQMRYKGEDELLTTEDVTKELFQEVFNNMMSSIEEDSIEQLILTIPPYFTSNQRRVLLEITRGDEFNHVLLINDVTAIIYRHIMQHMTGEQLIDANYIVYNFGYSSFDGALFSVKSGQIRARNITSRDDLGGRMITKALTSHILKENRPEILEGIELNATQLIKLEHEAEKIKKSLSCERQAVFEWSCLGFLTKSSVIITSEDMEDIAFSILTADVMIKSTQEVLDKAGFTKYDINQVILSGGSSRMPFISKFMMNHFGDDVVVMSEDPEMDAVIGAALYARESIPIRRSYNPRHLEDVRLPNVLARNTLTDQSLTLVATCGDLMRTHMVRRLFRTDGDEVHLEISEGQPNGKRIVIAEYRKVLAIPNESEIPLEFTVNIDQNGIATITNISMFKIRKSLLPTPSTPPAPDDKRKLEDSDDDEDSDGNQEECGYYTVSHANGGVGTIDLYSNTDDLKETISFVCELTGLRYEDVVFVKSEDQTNEHSNLYEIPVLEAKGGRIVHNVMTEGQAVGASISEHVRNDESLPEDVQPSGISVITTDDIGNQAAAVPDTENIDDKSDHYSYCANILENVIADSCTSKESN